MKEKLTKEGIGFLCISRMNLPIKFETKCVFLMTIEKFSQLNYSPAARKIFLFPVATNHSKVIGKTMQPWKF